MIARFKISFEYIEL